jgi:hypothetical protein
MSIIEERESQITVLEKWSGILKHMFPRLLRNTVNLLGDRIYSEV